MLVGIENEHPQRLALRDVSVNYGALRAVDGVSFVVRAGETLGLVGESGCGKTSLAKAISGIVVPESGTISVDGRRLSQLRQTSRIALAQAVQMIHQDAASALSPRMRVRELLAEPLRIAGRYNDENWRGIVNRLETVGLGSQLLDRYPHQLSGGQAKRIALIRAVVLDPGVLVADEPTAGLDLSVQGDILNLLVGLQKKLRLAYVLVSHNLNVVGCVTDRVAVMYLGQIVEIGSTRNVFSHTAHPYTAALISANQTLKGSRRRERIVLRGELPSPLNPPAGCRFHTRCFRAKERCRSETPPHRPLADDHTVACHFPLTSDQT